MNKQRKQPPTISRCDQVRAMQRQGGDKITAIMVSHESEPSKHQFIDGGYSSGHACKVFNCGLPASAEVHQGVEGRCEHGKTPSEYCFDCVRKQHNEDVLDGRFDEDEQPPPAKTIEDLANEVSLTVRLLTVLVTPDQKTDAQALLTKKLIQFAEEIKRSTIEP